MGDLAGRVQQVIRDVPDFPKTGIVFKDITPLLQNAPLYLEVVDWMSDGWGQVDCLVAMESRGFLFAPAMMGKLGAGLSLARKEGKLPHETISVSYSLEYGEATLQMHADAVRPGQRVLIVDDLLATGGTAKATCDLVRRLGGEIVGCCFLIELSFLKGRDVLDVPVRSLVDIP